MCKSQKEADAWYEEKAKENPDGRRNNNDEMRCITTDKRRKYRLRIQGISLGYYDSLEEAKAAREKFILDKESPKPARLRFVVNKHEIHLGYVNQTSSKAFKEYLNRERCDYNNKKDLIKHLKDYLNSASCNPIIKADLMQIVEKYDFPEEALSGLIKLLNQTQKKQ
tara:strand:+ start:1555 stop:2055 length:501 start_codon:yes stop_codon:yes gene_type:complete